MVLRDELVSYLDEYLRVRLIPDSGPMGLQVEGRMQIRRIVTGVSACLELFEAAVQREADLIMVHHGLLWDRDRRTIQGPLRQRLKFLLEHDLTLLAYHLCLDMHEEVGNNILAVKALGMHNISPLGRIGLMGTTEEMDFAELQELVRYTFDREPFAFPFGPEKIRRIGYCSGGAPDDLALAIEEGLEAYITGEVREKTMHMAKEAGIHFFAAGHYATERLGINALGEHLMRKMDVAVEFVDIPNPV
ncbi:MAG TPA: Nif3-like dinuclear metal center hexameric protein [bacterium]|nr:Nif3-like dinuclear metal center hexameric protein [bacterium]HPR86568.1 Nif3-like dinuclear metal center hexameric protein [bacterium]